MDIFAALAEPRRREIVGMLASNGQMSSSDISDQFKVTAAAISQHLKVLKEAELVRMEKRAQQRLYDINPESLEVVEDWARGLRQLWQARFEKLDKLLADGKEKN